MLSLKLLASPLDAVMVVATAIPLVFSHFELRAGQAANSPALIADAKEYRVHIFTTGVVFAALLAQWFNFPLDRIAALVIIVAIGKTGWELLADGMRVLLDASLNPDTLWQIREIIAAEPAVAELKWATGRNAGRFRFVEAGVTLRVSDLEKAEVATRRIEAQIRQAVPHVERVLIHAEPMERTHLRYAAPLADANGTLSEHFGEAPHFGLVTVRLADGGREQSARVAIDKIENARLNAVRCPAKIRHLNFVLPESDAYTAYPELTGKGKGAVPVRNPFHRWLKQDLRDPAPGSRF